MLLWIHLTSLHSSRKKTKLCSRRNLCFSFHATVIIFELKTQDTLRTKRKLNSCTQNPGQQHIDHINNKKQNERCNERRVIHLLLLCLFRTCWHSSLFLNIRLEVHSNDSDIYLKSERWFDAVSLIRNIVEMILWAHKQNDVYNGLLRLDRLLY